MANQLVIRNGFTSMNDSFVTGSLNASTTVEGQIVNARGNLTQGGADQTFVTDGLAAAFSIALV